MTFHSVAMEQKPNARCLVANMNFPMVPWLFSSTTRRYSFWVTVKIHLGLICP